MPRLPSGRIVGITHERARYHAARQGARLPTNPSHHQLHRLIDIIVADPAEGPEGWHQRYRFTGHTLADGRWLAQWPAADREAFLDWLRRKEQVREIDDARKRLEADEVPSRVSSYGYPQRLYSVLRRRIEALPMKAAPASQWRNTLRNLRRDGVRDEEIQWSGLPQFLDALRERGDRRVSREELLARMDFSPIRLELVTELVMRNEPVLPFSETASLMAPWRLALLGLPINTGDLCVLRFVDRRHNYRIGMLRARYAATTPRWFAISPFGGLLKTTEGDCCFASAEAAIAAANTHAAASGRVERPLRERNPYEYVTLHGGESYREWLLTLPDLSATYFCGHYAERNLLLHIRTKQRVDAMGRRLLFIEEIQSDWHQAAARFGYVGCWNGSIALAPFRRDWVSLAAKLMLMHAVEEGLDGIAWVPGAVQALRYGRELEPVSRVYDVHLPRALTRLAKPWGAGVATTTVATLDPWLRIAREQGGWRVTDRDGRLRTGSRLTRDEAQAIVRRHSRSVDLAVPLFTIPAGLRHCVQEVGLPLFGETLAMQRKS